MQAEFMNEFTADMIQGTDATHTSMSMGDILVERTTGDLFFCDRFGFVKLEG